MIMLAGLFTVSELNAQIILTTIISICYQVGQGLDQTACALIGNLIGAGKHSEAKKIYRSLLITTFSFTLVTAMLVLTFQNQIIGMFTTDVSVIKIAKESIPMVAFCLVPDSVKGMMKGAIKALGA